MTLPTNEVDKLLRRFDESEDVRLLDDAVSLADTVELARNATKAGSLEFRADKLRLLLSIFNHIDPRVIPGFDFGDLPSMSSAPPPETGLPPGVDPKSIADPELRARYERDIAANQAKAKTYTFQSRLQNAGEACGGAVERLAAAWFPESSQPALEKAIDDTVQSAPRRALLKERVAQVFATQR